MLAYLVQGTRPEFFYLNTPVAPLGYLVQKPIVELGCFSGSANVAVVLHGVDALLGSLCRSHTRNHRQTGPDSSPSQNDIL